MLMRYKDTSPFSYWPAKSITAFNTEALFTQTNSIVDN